MNPVSVNKVQFKEYLKNVGMSGNTANSYLSALNKVTASIRNICEIDLGSIYAVVDTRLLNHWQKMLIGTDEFDTINRERNGSPRAALKKYIEYSKYLSRKQSNR
ncbi:hypothetical protein [Alistipes finegoldii]|uniref:hypothetical protein n=1 Tax=Alistipes finegoldii TaxID=214856 RepID=UPI0026766AD2|nr:hypothetical protein [Alistipes finegoldii]